MINVLYFASIKEAIGRGGDTIDSVGIVDAQGVLDALLSQGEPWSEALDNERLLVAVNQEMAAWDAPVNVGDEVAFFPPVTGG